MLEYVPPLTLEQYAEEAQRTQRFEESDEGRQNLRFGYFGEIGGLLSALKKVRRDKLLENERDFASEELGDALWYVVALSQSHHIAAPDLGDAAMEALRLHYGEAAKPPEVPVTFRNLDSLVRAQARPGEPRDGLLSALASGAGELAALNQPQLNLREAPGLRTLFGQHLALLARCASSFGLSLNEIANANLRKITDRWPGPHPQYVDPFDADEVPYEQLPRRFCVAFEERTNGGRRHVVQSIKGVFIGDRLTDNSVIEDGYRFHDVFHLAYVAHLGWSPAIRGLLKRKRKSKPEVDENQDGARAAIIEEGIATWIFNQGKDRGDFFEGVEHGQLAFGLLKQIRQMVQGYEVERCPLWQWERAILDGFKVFRDLYTAKSGYVFVDMTAHTIEFSTTEPSE